MAELAQFALITVASVLFIVDPFAAIPTYLVITRTESPAERRRTALRACVAMTALLAAFAAVGRLLFQALGITLPAFRVAGGLILGLVALDMLRGQRSTQEGRPEVTEGEAKDDVALTPLAIPILAGPGAISTVMVLNGEAASWAHRVIVFGAIVVTGVTSYICLRLGERLVSSLGQTGIRVLTRIMGLLLAAVATQFVLTGVREAMAR
ncbi:MAG: MarC family protein [Gemmatimonadales bacterium]